MGPSIGRSIKQGFWAANRSWPAMGYMAAAWILTLLAAVLIGALTSFPQTLLRHAKTARPVVMRHTSATAATSAPVTPAEEAARQEWAARDRLAVDWFKRAWPALVVCLLPFMAMGLWLYGGQIGYLGALLTTQRATLADFWTSGTRSFGPLVGAVLLCGLLFVGLVGVAGGVPVLLFRLAPLLGAVGVLVAIGAILWLMIRTVFWWVAVVLDQPRPVTGLKASWRASRGYLGRIVGLWLLLVLISLGAFIPIGVLQMIGRAIGGIGGAVIAAVANISAILLLNLYLGFAVTAAYIRFYLDAKSATASTPTSPSPVVA